MGLTVLGFAKESQDNTATEPINPQLKHPKAILGMGIVEPNDHPI